MSRRRSAGALIVAPLLGATLGAIALAGIVSMVGTASRWVVRADRRAEAHDTADLIVQALMFDLRRAGWSPTAESVPALVAADVDALELHADLDGDGSIDPASAERIRYRFAAPSRALRRLVGHQSMPLGNIVTEFDFTFLRADGTVVPIPAGGLDAALLADVRAVRSAFKAAHTGSVAATRSMTVILRGAS